MQSTADLNMEGGEHEPEFNPNTDMDVSQYDQLECIYNERMSPSEVYAVYDPHSNKVS
jgi:hypothetical protein